MHFPGGEIMSDDPIRPDIDLAAYRQLIERISPILHGNNPKVRVWIAQCLCPMRHAILGGAGEAADEAEARAKVLNPLEGAVQEAIQIGALNPWCGLCHAKIETWTYEIGRTRFTSMPEAEPALRQNAREQAAVRALFGDMKRSD
jgi:hypothetical protein